MAAPRQGGGEMFDAIAPRYDLLNHVLSFGLDLVWRRHAARALALDGGSTGSGEPTGPAGFTGAAGGTGSTEGAGRAEPRVLDVAFGTGDQAAAVLQEAGSATVFGLDPSRGMVRRGRDKLGPRAALLLGDAHDLPFADGSFDAVTIAFGIRNVPDRARGLREMARVLRPGGRLAVLELGTPRGRILGPAARWWVSSGVRRVGRVLTGSQAYAYLEQSVLAFPEPDAFARMMQDAGLEVTQVRPMTFGACTLYVGRRAHSSEAAG